MSIATFNNPFMFDSHKQDETPANAEYAIVRKHDVTGPEVDRVDADVLEVTVRWGRTVLGVAHLPTNGSLSIGEDDQGALLVPSEALGCSSFKLVDAGTLRIPTTARGTVEQNGVATALDASSLNAGMNVGKDVRVRFTLGDGDRAITVQVARVAAARPTPRRASLKKGLFFVAVGSLVAHLGLVTALAFSPGASLDDDNAPLDKETSAHMISAYQAADAHELPTQQEAEATKGTGAGENGGAHKGPSGMAGTLTSKNTEGAYAIKSAETKEEKLGHIHALIESQNYGALGALRSVYGTQGPTDMASMFDDSVGHDAMSYEGHLVGAHAGDAFGYNGFGLDGTGNGGNGFTDGIGLGPIGGFGHGPGIGGTGIGNCLGDGPCGPDEIGGGTVKKGLKRPSGTNEILIPGDTSIEGSLPPEIVQRIVRANFPRFRACYDMGLKKDPDLRGTIKTRFIIDQTGGVETANMVSSTVNDGSVNACVVGVFSTLSFPEPSNGKARVVYPIDFDHE